MSKNTENQPNLIRRRVIAFLLFFTSDECFALLETFVPGEKLAVELSRIWFDDIYSPGTRYLNAIKGDFSDEKSSLFEQCFDVEELVELERFHHFFELRLDMFSNEFRATGAMPQNDSWQNLRKHAGYVLAELEPDFVEKRRLFEQQVKDSLALRGKLPDPAQWPNLISPPKE